MTEYRAMRRSQTVAPPLRGLMSEGMVGWGQPDDIANIREGQAPSRAPGTYKMRPQLLHHIVMPVVRKMVPALQCVC